MEVGCGDSAGMEESAFNTLWMLKRDLAIGNVNTGDVLRKSNEEEPKSPAVPQLAADNNSGFC